ncbi:uncharacterized protein LOC143225349 isoform X2 [Tachypleus tridentatus]|uniref:uncharacterized protein LOC143225349 isoform X2 n=1 Tax=Tachypleus tridentatus TaxID=6853 RepID=UPI003FD25B24
MKISVTCYYVKATNGTPTHETCWLETSGSKRRPGTTKLELLFCGEPQKKFISPREDVKKHQWCDIAMIICVHSTGLLLYFLSTVTDPSRNLQPLVLGTSPLSCDERIIGYMLYLDI